MAKTGYSAAKQATPAGIATSIIFKPSKAGETEKDLKNDVEFQKFLSSGGTGDPNKENKKKDKKDKIRINEKQKDHIFRDADGHFAEDNLSNRQKLEDVVNNGENYLGKYRFGNDWYTKTSVDGTQTWGKVRNGSIENGGINKIPRSYNSQTGLSNPIKP
ncbi:hypothetical protein ACTNDY_00445 [Tissierellaceae bacterium HCP3S3_D8]